MGVVMYKLVQVTPL